MNDELDALRSFRPEATGPTDALQLQARTALLGTIGHAPTRARHGMPSLRPRGRILLGVAIALVAAVGTAGAAGVIPGDVQQALGLAGAHDPDAALSPQIDQAVERVSAPTADGGTVQLWTAPTTGGGTCAYLRQLDASGAPTDSGPTSCAVSIAGGGRMGAVFGQSGSRQAASAMTIGVSRLSNGLSAQVEVDATGAATAFGEAPSGVAKVKVVDSAGTVLDEAAVNDGWFLLTLPADTGSAASSLVAQSPSGAVVATLLIAPKDPPTTATASVATSGG